jgi:hypothetical protein
MTDIPFRSAADILAEGKAVPASKPVDKAIDVQQKLIALEQRLLNVEKALFGASFTAP